MVNSFLASLSDFFGGAPGSSRHRQDMQRDMQRESAYTQPYDRAEPSALSTMSLPSMVFPQRGADAPSLPTHMRKSGTVIRAWTQILRFCDTSYEELRDTLNWGATEQEVDALQAGLGQALPLAVREWLYCCNGQEVESTGSCSDGLFFGLPFLTTDAILREWQFWRYVDNDPQSGANPGLRKRMKSCPDRWVRREYSCPGWIPLVTDHMGNYLGVDLMPEPSGGGGAGQVIVFGRDFDTKVVLYGCDGQDGWAKFLQLLADELEAGTSFQLERPEDSDGDEDTIGYEGYFTGGTSGAKGGGTDRAGEPSAGFFLVGEYKNWPVFECWVDRATRRWEAAGMATERTDAESSTQPLATPTRSDAPPIGTPSTPNASLDPLDPLHVTPVDMPLPQPPGVSASSPTGSPRRRERREKAPRPRTIPAPQPLLDLPTIEEVRAIEATEQARADAQPPSRMGALRDMAAFSLAPAYRTMAPRGAAPQGESVELAFRSSSDAAREGSPVPHHPAVVGLRGSRNRTLADASDEGNAAMRSTARLIDAQTPDHLVDSPRSTPRTAPSEHIVAIDEGVVPA